MAKTYLAVDALSLLESNIGYWAYELEPQGRFKDDLKQEMSLAILKQKGRNGLGWYRVCAINGAISYLRKEIRHSNKMVKYEKSINEIRRRLYGTN